MFQTIFRSLFFFLPLPFIVLLVTAQNPEVSVQSNFFEFTVSTQQKISAGKDFSFVSVFKNNEILFTDSVANTTTFCNGFSFPESQPLKGYFIFVKHEKQNGKIYILYKNGEYRIIYGGTFWVAPKHQLLFILAERDLTNLLIYDLRKMKTLVEKFNCDEFTGWYLKNGNYLGAVDMECGVEPESEKELTEWMKPVMVEEFETKKSLLYETHYTEEDLKKAKPLHKYAICK